MLTSKHTVQSYESELQNIINSIQSMGEKVIKLIKFSEQALEKSDNSLIQNSKDQDREINELDSLIENQAIEILALRQPVAVDLRFVVSAIKISSLLERMGDRAKKTVKRAANLETKLDKTIHDDIQKMNDLVIKMIEGILKNIKDYDFTSLKKTWQTDDQVDDYYSEVLEIILDKQNKNPIDLKEFISIIKIIKNFERIGDYATKLAKIVYYIEEGKRTTNFN